MFVAIAILLDGQWAALFELRPPSETIRNGARFVTGFKWGIAIN
jgi:hypothetical protein